MPNKTAFVLTHESDPQRTTKAISLIALALTRSLGRQGIPVVRVHPNRLDRSLTSRYCTAVEVSPDFYASEAELLEFLLGLPQRYGGLRVLIPASDDCAWFVARYHAELSTAFAVVAPPFAVVETILDKQRQYEKAQELGIPIPETYFPGSLEEVAQLAPVLTNYPYVIKPLVAHAWRRAAMKGVSKGKKGFAVRNAEELIGRYEEIARGDRRIMIQEVIGGADDRLYTFLSYFDAQSQPLAYCIRKKLRQLPLDFGYCTLTETCHDETVREQSLRLLSGLGYHGISGVEWKCDPQSGIYKLIEVNPRAVNTTAIAAACGVDLPAIAFRDKAGAPGEAVTDWADGVKWVNFEQDIWAARALNSAGKLSWRAWWRSLSGHKVEGVFALDDLKPGAGHWLGLVKARLRRLRERRGRPAGLPGGRPVPGGGTT